MSYRMFRRSHLLLSCLYSIYTNRTEHLLGCLIAGMAETRGICWEFRGEKVQATHAQRRVPTALRTSKTDDPLFSKEHTALLQDIPSAS